jgi:hypothetical protein
MEGGTKPTNASSTGPSKKQDHLRAGYEEMRVSQKRSKTARYLLTTR